MSPSIHAGRPPWSKDIVRHAGETVAVVIAESRYIAEDAAEDILVEYEPLPVVVDLEKALTADSPLVHDDLDSNVAAQLYQQKGNYEKAQGTGRHCHKATILSRPRRGGSHGEPRGCGGLG